ncbi:MAG: endonuclease/exonuclease/phosphatase family protein [Prevotella sp.]|nr:endonuclease/exonuclease/phosphatase family protein [Prevotella sp.]MDY4218142.1 endonuclease/exonuclease/phosphatase family protein [Prevotella sp.]
MSFNSFRKAWSSLFFKTFFIINTLAIVIMAAVGNVDKVNPIAHPVLSTLHLCFPIILGFNLFFLVFWVFVRIRTIWLPVLGLLLCYVPIRKYAPFNPYKLQPQTGIKVLSYNVYLFASWEFAKDERNPIVDYILKSKSDLVCLQEAPVRALNKADLSALKAQYAYVDIIDNLQPGSKNMIFLSRFPILQREEIKYQSEGNMSMAYLVDINGVQTLVVNNHFESFHLNSEDKSDYKKILNGDLQMGDSKKETMRLLHKLGDATARRAPQAEKVAAYVRTYTDRRIPVILCGDFNDTSLSYVHRTIGKTLNDCFIASGNGLGISYHQSGMFFRIDHIFCSSDFVSKITEVDSSIDKSDHYPIFTWLKYQPKP